VAEDRSIERDPARAILIVDGEVLVRHAVADYLRRCGYAVIEAADSDEAIVVLGENSLAIDAMLCDVTIAGSMNGFELRLWARQYRPGLEVILAGTIPAVAEAAAQLCDEGPDIARPYDPQGVVDHIKRLMAQRERTDGDALPLP
jgi:DNA-binding NtrC family response regulator